MHQEVIDFIELFHPKEQPSVGLWHELIYANGQCFRFAQILCTAFHHYDSHIVGVGMMLEGTPYHTLRKEVLRGTYNHYYARIDGSYYHIFGCDGSDPSDFGVDVEILDPSDFRTDNVHEIAWLSHYFDEHQCLKADTKFMRVLSQEEINSVLQLGERYHNPRLEAALTDCIKQLQ
jgi:hypothetical protein